MGDVPFYAKIWWMDEDPCTRLQCADVRSIFARNTYSKKVQLTLIGSPLRAFQLA